LCAPKIEPKLKPSSASSSSDEKAKRFWRPNYDDFAKLEERKIRDEQKKLAEKRDEIRKEI